MTTTKKYLPAIVEVRRMGREGLAVEFRFGDYVAFGTYESRREYAIIHAPTQEDFDAIAAAIEDKHTIVRIS